MKFTSTHAFILVIILIIGGIFALQYAKEPTKEVSAAYDEFSQCLADSGAVFYGAFWCPFCNEQKQLLKNSQNIPYVECSTYDKKGQTAVCIEEEIKSYPTWEYPDGERITGVQQLSVLSEKTGCALPNEAP